MSYILNSAYSLITTMTVINTRTQLTSMVETLEREMSDRTLDVMWECLWRTPIESLRYIFYSNLVDKVSLWK